MIARFRISLLAAALFGLATLGAGSPAKAALRLQIKVVGTTTHSVDINQSDFSGPNTSIGVTGGTATLVSDPFTGLSIQYSGTLNNVNFVLGVTSTTNEPGGPYFGFVSASGSFTNQESRSRVVTITSSADAFMQPVPTPAITQALSMSGTLLQGGLSAGQGTGKVNGGSPTNTSSTLQSGIYNLNNTGSLALQPPITNSIPVLDAPYSVSTSFTANLTNRASVTGFAITQTLTKPVPEPTTIAMAGVGVVLSLGAALRRRKRS